MYDVNLTLCSKTDPVIPYFLSVFLLKSFQLALHFSPPVQWVLLEIYTFRMLGRRSYESDQEIKDRIRIVSLNADNCFYNTLIISNHR